MKAFFLLTALMLSEIGYANVCGTDFQNFNPTTNGIDFVTVQSSETLRPCFMNIGTFVNYSVNNLTYTQTVTNTQPAGQVRKDKVTGADLSLGLGLTDRWDAGVNMGFVLDHSNEAGANYAFKKSGATEIKFNTKYHLGEYKSFGFAAILSANKNLIGHNPFTGNGPGLTVNYELAADTKLATKWALGVNVGYRDRNPGEKIPAVPFVPLDDQWIYSAAGSYLIPEKDIKVILEVYGSRAAKHVNGDVDKNLNNLEGLVGVKYDHSENLALHGGVASRLSSDAGGADWRLYAGLNWAFGPICDKSVVESIKDTMGGPEVYRLNINLFFASGSDQIPEERLGKFDEEIEKIKGKGFQRIEVGGHTDSVGNEAFNLDLSQRRANFVRNRLISRHGVKPGQVDAKGFGETEPIADNGNFQGRQKNRRVEFKVWR